MDKPATRQNADTVTPIKRYAMIAGKRIPLPIDAKFYFQDKRGLWFWSNRKPRVMDDDWTPNKSPVQVCDERGRDRCLITPITEAQSHSGWKQSVARTVNLEDCPVSMAIRANDLNQRRLAG